jgi:hypothetical protein
MTPSSNATLDATTERSQTKPTRKRGRATSSKPKEFGFVLASFDSTKEPKRSNNEMFKGITSQKKKSGGNKIVLGQSSGEAFIPAQAPGGGHSVASPASAASAGLIDPAYARTGALNVSMGGQQVETPVNRVWHMVHVYADRMPPDTLYRLVSAPNVYDIFTLN